MLNTLKPKYSVQINKSDCDVCEKKENCNCFKSELKECPMICVGCGICMCNPEKKDCCIDGHYAYNGDYVMCTNCWEKQKVR